MIAKVFINAGHAPDGNPDPGAVNTLTGQMEYKVNSNIALLLSFYLNNAGIQTKVLQSDSLEEVCQASNDFEADIFISIHCNASDNKWAEGCETWYLTNSDKGKALACYVMMEILSAIDVTNRGVRESIPGESGLYVLQHTAAPSILVETAFISNPSDARLLGDTYIIEQFARAIARGVTDYAGVEADLV